MVVSLGVHRWEEGPWWGLVPVVGRELTEICIPYAQLQAWNCSWFHTLIPHINLRLNLESFHDRLKPYETSHT